MSTFDLIYGNKKLKRLLSGLAESRSFPNSFIISGNEGSGRTLCATVCAMAIACTSEKNPCGECQSCKKIKNGICADVITVSLERDRKTIGVEAVRDLKESAYIVPNDLSVKIYIIKNAEKMTHQAQNALLKLFEEGPNNVYFILLTDNSSALLPTVRSRAPELKTEAFSCDDLSTLLCEHSEKAAKAKTLDPILFSRIVNASNGSYGKALSLFENGSKKELKIYEKAEELLSLLCEENKAPLLTALLSESAERQSFSQLLRLMHTGIRDLFAQKKHVNIPLLLFASREKANMLSQKFTLKALSELSSVIEEALSDVQNTNINLRTAVLELYGKLKDCK